MTCVSLFIILVGSKHSFLTKKGRAKLGHTGTVKIDCDPM